MASVIDTKTGETYTVSVRSGFSATWHKPRRPRFRLGRSDIPGAWYAERVYRNGITITADNTSLWRVLRTTVIRRRPQ